MGSISFDDLYNNFKIVKPEDKRSVTSSSNSGSHKLAFVSGHSSTNDVNTANVHEQKSQDIQEEQECWKKFFVPESFVSHIGKMDLIGLHGLFTPPSIDLSNSGLEKFKQPEFEGYGVKGKENGTDISKFTRKPSKTGKHGHENGRVYKSRKQGQEKVNPQSNSQRKVKPWSTKVNHKKDKIQNNPP
ncbi:hypothetical protein Tco_0285289 [Tanacetum coccineum]